MQPSFTASGRGVGRGVGPRICIITNGGGSGVLAADECMRQGLEVMGISEGKKIGLRKIFPAFFGINNPIDLTGQARDEDYASALDEVSDDYDGFLIIALPNVLGITEKLAEVLKESKERINKPVVSYIASGGISVRLARLLQRARIPVYPSPERAVRGLKALID
jgi:acyl-CoA synthetase (NDP forming)